MADRIPMHEAMKQAIQNIEEIYKDENLTDVEIEEVEHDMEGNWSITVGFTRPKTRQTLGGLTIPARSLKRVIIDSYDGRFKGMKMYQPGQ